MSKGFNKFVNDIYVSLFCVIALLAITDNAARAHSIHDIKQPIINSATKMNRNIRNYRQYDVFRNTSWRRFEIVNNSTRINSKSPRMCRIVTFPNVYRGGRYPQSLNVDAQGRYAYIGFDSFKNDGSKVIKYNLRRHHLAQVGKTFHGGHAQAVSNDSKNNLWFINRQSNDESDDHEGPINKGSFVEVSPKSLKPIYKRNFKFGHNYMGDNLAFAGKYGVFNVSRIWGRNHTSNHYRRHMLVIYYSNKLDRIGSQWERLLSLRKTPGFYLIQATGYNPRNKRLYIASDEPNVFLSLPVLKLLNRSLRNRDVRISLIRLSYGQEIEGLSFDKKGYMYLLLGSPGQLLKSKRPVNK